MSEKQPSEPIPFDEDKTYTVEQVAKRLHKSTKTVRGLIKARKLKAYRFGREFIVTASQLREFASERVLKKWFGDIVGSDLDPAHVPLELEEVNIDTLTHKELDSALVAVSDLETRKVFFEFADPAADTVLDADAVDDPIVTVDPEPLHRYLRNQD